MWVIFFCVGVAWFLLRLHELEILLFLVLSCQIAFYKDFKLTLSSITWLTIGILVGYWHEYINFPVVKNTSNYIQDTVLIGTISSIPKQDHQKRQFEFDVQTIDKQNQLLKVWLTCYRRCPNFKVGEVWSVRASLRKPYDTVVYGENSPLMWMRSRHIQYFGQVHHLTKAYKIANADSSWWLENFRYKLSQDMQKTFGFQANLGLVQGLTLGIASLINKQDWELFRRTGTTHLVVISGEHIGLVAGACFTLTRWVWIRYSPFKYVVPAQTIASYLAWIIACFYACLTGLGPPMERAMLAYSVYLFKFIGHYRCSFLQVWRLALFLIVIFEPHALLTPGLYLSFFAVLILVLTHRRFKLKGWRQTLVLQTSCLLGLSPLSLYAFAYTSLNGFIINLIAIPWVGWLIVPSAILALLINEVIPWSGWWHFTNYACLYFYNFLTWMDQFKFINLETPLESLFSLISVTLGLGLCFFLPKRNLYVFYIIMILAPFFCHSGEKISPNTGKLTMFAVGHGLAIMIQTSHHVLLYDTGGKVYPNADFVQQKILPWIKHQGIRKLDALIISDRNLNHIGGLPSINQYVTVKKFFSHDSKWVNMHNLNYSCEQSVDWVWDGVKFVFLRLPNFKNTDLSTGCVLKIITKNKQILVTGDLDAVHELYLLNHYSAKLKSDILIIPHHGKFNSSSAKFLAAIQPHLALLSSSAHHHTHLPSKRLLNLYAVNGVMVKNTSEYGSLVLAF